MSKTAKLYRLKSNDHVCPFGIKSKLLLERHGYVVDDHQLSDKNELEQFKQAHNVKTTPQVFINNERIGGYEDLRKYLGLSIPSTDGITYKPVMYLFSVTLLMSISLVYTSSYSFNAINILEKFIAISMCTLAILKLQDLYSFSNQFISYDLLAQNSIPYSYMYPFIEAGAGILMLSSKMIWLAAPAAIFIGLVGGISVFKAVYIDKREIKCACVGGNSNVPLGFISLTENIMMVAMGVWMMFSNYIIS